MREFLSESDRRQRAEQLAQDCQKQLDDKNRDIYKLNMQLETLKDITERYSQLQSAVQKTRSMKEFPDTPTKIAQYFEAVYPERIAFTARAYRSLKECTTKCDVLWEAFYYISTDLYDLIQKILLKPIGSLRIKPDGTAPVVRGR